MELWVWADAICIDQSDDSERGHQVQLVSKIFPGAELVMCWIPNATNGRGQNPLYEDEEEDEYLRRALETLETISKELRLVGTETGKPIYKMNPDDERLINWMKDYTELCEIFDTIEWPYWENKAWFAVGYFFDLQYWERLWILQEIVLAQDVLLFCKSGSLSWPDTLIRVMD